MIKILIADDQALFLDGLKMLIGKCEEVSIVGEARNGQEVLDQVGHAAPDIVITDIQMPEMDGIELTKVLHEYYPSIGVIALTMFQEDHLIVDMLEAGARGYLLKTSSREKLFEAIRVVYNNGSYFCEQTNMKLIKKILASRLPVPNVPEGIHLTDTEVQIIEMVGKGFSSKEIGDQLDLNKKTVDNYRMKIIQKMGVRNSAEMVYYGLKWGIISLK